MPPKKHTSVLDKKRIYEANVKDEDAILLGRHNLKKALSGP